MYLNFKIFLTLINFFFQYKGVYRNVSLQAVDYSALLQDEDNLDPSPSDPLEIVLPKDQDGIKNYPSQTTSWLFCFKE